MDRCLAHLRESLPEEQLQAEWAQGRGMTVQQAVAEARSVMATG
jgi:hypothetical protein